MCALLPEIKSTVVILTEDLHSRYELYLAELVARTNKSNVEKEADQNKVASRRKGFLKRYGDQLWGPSSSTPPSATHSRRADMDLASSTNFFQRTKLDRFWAVKIKIRLWAQPSHAIYEVKEIAVVQARWLLLLCSCQRLSEERLYKAILQTPSENLMTLKKICIGKQVRDPERLKGLKCCHPCHQKSFSRCPKCRLQCRPRPMRMSFLAMLNTKMSSDCDSDSHWWFVCPLLLEPNKSELLLIEQMKLLIKAKSEWPQEYDWYELILSRSWATFFSFCVQT